MELEERVARLEQELQELKSGRNTVQAPFSVVDETGRPILQVDVWEQGRGLRLLSPSGRVRLMLAGSPGGGRVAVWNSRGALAAVLDGSAEDGGGRFAVIGAQSEPVAVLTSDGMYGSLTFYSSDMEPVVMLGGTEGGDGFLSVCDRDGCVILESPPPGTQGQP